jgi:hypothetical protein
MSTPVYLVAAPIGDYMQDMSVAAIHTLRSVRHVFVEADDQFVERLRGQQILTGAHRVYSLARDQLDRARELIASEQPFAIVASSGIPCFLDPGRNIVRLCLDEHLADVELVPIGMSSALDAALCMCGTDIDRFLFNGHYPENYDLTGPFPDRAVPLVYFVRGPAVTAFVRESTAAIEHIQRIVVLKDMRKKQRARVMVLHPARPEGLAELPVDEADADYTCVIDRRPPEPRCEEA